MELPTLATFAHRPREALMWVPRALDVARMRAALVHAGIGLPAGRPRIVDVGAGTGLLARLLDLDVVAVDPSPPEVRYHPIVARAEGAFDAAVVSWMEAGKDYRAEVAKAAPVVVNVYDVEGGCGVMGQVDFAPFGFVEAASWRTPSFEDAAFAFETKGALKRRAHPGNRIDVLCRDASLAPRLRSAVEGATAGAAFPWEAEMDRLRI